MVRRFALQRKFLNHTGQTFRINLDQHLFVAKLKFLSSFG